MRFGQLGEAGICTRLDSAGVLTHRVAGIDDIEYAMDNPPLVGRACLRGRYVRELSGAGERYACDWHRLCDYRAAPARSQGPVHGGGTMATGSGVR
jgi:hypothetical protein